jgi:hypothetical protein
LPAANNRNETSKGRHSTLDAGLFRAPLQPSGQLPCWLVAELALVMVNWRTAAVLNPAGYFHAVAGANS